MPQSPRRRKSGLLPTAVAEYLILADAVEALNGKLYMMGGGWDTMYVRDPALPVALSFACGVQIPWNVTDDDHTLSVTIRNPDGADVAPPFSRTDRVRRADSRRLLTTCAETSLRSLTSAHVPFLLVGSLARLNRASGCSPTRP